MYFSGDENSDDKIKHEMRVIEDFRDVGFSACRLRHLESRRLPEIVEKNEQIKAAIVRMVFLGRSRSMLRLAIEY